MNVLIIGGSKGIGAALVKELDSKGIGGCFTYFSSEKRARHLQESSSAWKTIRLDLSSDLNQQVLKITSKPKVLVFTSAAGLEAVKDSKHSYAVNSSGPSRLLMALDRTSHCPESVVFVTSYEAHHFGEFSEFESYELVAESKKYGELFCRETCRSRLSQQPRFVTVASELVIGSTAHTILSLRDPAAVRSVTDKGREVNMVEITTQLADIVQGEINETGERELIEIVGNNVTD